MDIFGGCAPSLAFLPGRGGSRLDAKRVLGLGYRDWGLGTSRDLSFEGRIWQLNREFESFNVRTVRVPHETGDLKVKHA